MECVAVERSYRRHSGRLPRLTSYHVATVSVVLQLTVCEFTSVLAKVTRNHQQLPPETLEMMMST